MMEKVLISLESLCFIQAASDCCSFASEFDRNVKCMSNNIVQMSRSEHAVVDDAGEDDGTEKKKKKKGAQDEASEYALVAADAGEDDGTEKKKKKRKGA
ncbi:hypothetical protein Tco_0685513 [Tanacetum coccineum]